MILQRNLHKQSLSSIQQQRRHLSYRCNKSSESFVSNSGTLCTTTKFKAHVTKLLEQNQPHRPRHSSFETYTPSPPETLTPELAAGIADAVRFFIRNGIGRERLKLIAASGKSPSPTPLLERWQQMMEVLLTTQLHVISGMGYEPSEKGMARYAVDLAQCIQNLESKDDTMKELLMDVRRDMWREMVSISFDLDVSQIPVISTVQARNIMHMISSKMIQPEILAELQDRTSKLDGSTNGQTDSDVDDDGADADSKGGVTVINPEEEIASRHKILQDIIINRVYMGGNPSILEQCGLFDSLLRGNSSSNEKLPGTDKAYAMLQCAMSDHESDPLIGQYANAAIVKMWEAAGLDLNSINS